MLELLDCCDEIFDGFVTDVEVFLGVLKVLSPLILASKHLEHQTKDIKQNGQN